MGPALIKKAAQALAGAIWLLPFLLLLILSVGRQWVFPAALPQEWTLAYWAAAFDPGGSLNQSLWASLLMSLSIAAVATGLGFATSRQLAKRWLFLAYLPYAMAPVILAACLQHYFLVMGLSGKWGGVWMAQLCLAYPFAVIFFSAFWNRRMHEMEQLAQTLGAAPGQTFRKVLLPMSRGALLVCYFQTFLISWFEYGMTSLIGVGKVQTLTVKVFQYVQEANIFLAALAACLLFLPPAILLWINKRYLYKTL